MTVDNKLFEEVKKHLIKTMCKGAMPQESSANIYFENFTRDNLMFIQLGKMILAKGIQNKINGHVISLSKRRDRQYDKFCKDIHFSSVIFSEECQLYEMALAHIYTYLICKYCNSKEKILKLKFKGIYIGDLIYNSIIRFSKMVYSIDRIDTAEGRAVVKDAILYTMFSNRIFKKQKPDFYILDEIGYVDAVMPRMARKYGAKLIQYFATLNCCFIESDQRGRGPFYHSYRHKNIDQLLATDLPCNWLEEVETHLDTLFRGEGYINKTAKTVYSGKRVKSREELKKQLGIENAKKNVIILSHCFSDCPVSSNSSIYADYYEWLEETLKIVSHLNNANWIVRPHPMRHSYGEENEIEKLYNKYKSNNLYFMSEEYSANTIPMLADAIITVTGTAGIEYSCLGIPCITTGTPFYSHYGFTLNVKTVEQYKKVLRRAHNIKKLSELQILEAKKIMFAFARIVRMCDDSFMVLANKESIRFETESSRLRSNNDYLRDVYEWLQDNVITDSYLYQFGYTLGENERSINRACK